MNNNINNNVNFTARMDLSRVTMNKARWENIASLFEQKTTKYPHDTFQLEDIANGIGGYNVNSNTGEEICVNIFGVEFDKLMNMADSKIVSKFKKMLEISAHKQKIYDATTQYENKLAKITKENVDYIEIWDKAVDIADKEANIMKDKDSFLRNIDIMF